MCVPMLRISSVRNFRIMRLLSLSGFFPVEKSEHKFSPRLQLVTAAWGIFSLITKTAGAKSEALCLLPHRNAMLHQGIGGHATNKRDVSCTNRDPACYYYVKLNIKILRQKEVA